MNMAGSTRATYLRGRKVFENGERLVEPGMASSSSQIKYKICNERFPEQFDREVDAGACRIVRQNS